MLMALNHVKVDERYNLEARQIDDLTVDLYSHIIILKECSKFDNIKFYNVNKKNRRK